MGKRGRPPKTTGYELRRFMVNLAKTAMTLSLLALFLGLLSLTGVSQTVKPYQPWILSAVVLIGTAYMFRNDMETMWAVPWIAAGITFAASSMKLPAIQQSPLPGLPQAEARLILLLLDLYILYRLYRTGDRQALALGMLSLLLFAYSIGGV